MLDAEEIEMSETVQVYEFKVQVYEFKTSQGNISRTPPQKKEQGRQKSWDSYQTTKLSFRSLWIRSRGCSHPGFSSSLPQSSYGSRDDHVMLLTFFFKLLTRRSGGWFVNRFLGVVLQYLIFLAQMHLPWPVSSCLCHFTEW